jgi:hypothetical protein
MLCSAGWILLGVVLGTVISMGMPGSPAESASVDAMSLATLTVFMMLAETLRAPRESQPGIR